MESNSINLEILPEPNFSLRSEVMILDPQWNKILDQPEKFCCEIVNETFERCLMRRQFVLGLLSEVSIVLTENKFIQKLNKQYRNLDKPTNVLSFPNIENFNSKDTILGDFCLIGDIVISYEMVLEESQKAKKPMLNHFAHMLVHGMLHLMGFTHNNDYDSREMESLESLILDHFGYSD